MIIHKSHFPGTLTGKSLDFVFLLPQLFEEIAARYGLRAHSDIIETEHTIQVRHPLPKLGAIRIGGRPRDAGELLLIIPRVAHKNEEYTVALKLLSYAFEHGDRPPPGAIITLKAIVSPQPWRPGLSNQQFVAQWGGPPVDVTKEERQVAPREMWDRWAGWMREFEVSPHPASYEK